MEIDETKTKNKTKDKQQKKTKNKKQIKKQNIEWWELKKELENRVSELNGYYNNKHDEIDIINKKMIDLLLTHDKLQFGNWTYSKEWYMKLYSKLDEFEKLLL